METYLQRALEAGDVVIEESGRGERIRYVAADRSERWSDPEEKVRADYYAELIYRYKYDAKKIGVEVIVPDRTPHDAADLVVFHDLERKRPFAVIECKAENVSTPQFEQAVEQACGNGTAHKFRASFVGVVAGQTRRFLEFDDEQFGALERDRNRVADLPSGYGKPPRWKFAKGDPLSHSRAFTTSLRKSWLRNQMLPTSSRAFANVEVGETDFFIPPISWTSPCSRMT